MLLYLSVAEPLFVLLSSREALIEAVWEEDTRWVTEQAFDALLRRLRDRLNQIDPDYDYIVTVRGHGLRLQNEPH